MDEFSCDIEEAAAAICRYLADHPHAADTARGIAQIWLRQRYPLALVQETLRRLESRGQLKARPVFGVGAGGDVLYSALAKAPGPQDNGTS